MILVDTNVIIDFWDNPTEIARQIFDENEIAICGVVKTELLRGSKSEKQFADIKNALDNLPCLTFSESDWIELAKQLVALRQNGLAVPFQDAMIAYLAIKNDCEVWTNDKHFRLMQIALPDLKLFIGAKSS